MFTYEDSFWHEQGQNGDCYFETAVIGGTWVQREGIMSTLVPPERLAAFLTTSQAQLEAELTEEMVEAFGERARDTQAVFFRRWGVDPWTRGYITGWRARRRDVRGPAARHARAARSTCAARTSGSAATWREPCAPAAPPPPPRSLLT